MIGSKRWLLAAGGALAGTGLVVALSATGAAAGTAVAATAAGGCAATATVSSQWGSGEIVTVMVANTSTVASTRWTVTFSLVPGQSVQGSWNAAVSTADGTVTANNMPYNGALAPGSSTSFGMQLNGTGAVTALGCASDATGGTRILTEADNQTTVTVLYGQIVDVALAARFRPVAETGTALTLLSTSGGYPTGQPLAASYRVTGTSEVDLSTITDAPCLHTPPYCGMPQQLWTVHVRVVAPPTPS